MWWIALLCLVCPVLRAQTPGQVDPTFGASLGLAGSVAGSLVQPDSKVLVCGYFGQGIARLNADGGLDGSFTVGTGPNAAVLAMALQPDGKVVIGGIFTSFNGVTRNGLARLNTDGSLDTSFDPGGGLSGGEKTVSSIAMQSDGKILVGGFFSAIAGVTHMNIARLSTNGSLDGTFNPGTDDDGFLAVSAVAVQTDGKIVLGGGFTHVNGVTRNGITRLNPDGSFDTGFNASTGFQNGAAHPGATITGFYITAVALQANGQILVGSGGFFAGSAGTERNGIIRLNTDGTADTSFNPGAGASDVVNTISVQADGKIIVGGNFTAFNLQTRNYFARLNANGSLDSGFDPSAAANTYVIAVASQPDGKTLIGGRFTNVDAIVRNGVARLNADGTLDKTFVADAVLGPNNPVQAVALQSDGKIVAGGLFSAINGVARNGLIRFNADGSPDTSFDLGAGAGYADDNQPDVLNVAVQPAGDIVFVGSFFNFDGTPCDPGIARVGATGTLEAAVDNSVGSYDVIYALAVQTNGKILTANYLRDTDGDPDNFLISRLNADGSLDTGFNRGTGPNDLTVSLAVQPDGQIIATGYFTAYNSVARAGVARLSAAGSLDTSYNPGANANGAVSGAVVQPNGQAILFGAFSTYSGVARHGLVRLNADGSLDASFDPGVGANGSLTKCVLQADGKVIIAGSFTTVDGVARNGIARLTATGGLDMSFDPGTGANGAIRSVAVQPDSKIIIGGTFNRVDGLVRNYVARLTALGGLDPGFNPGVGVPNVAALALQPTDGKVIVGGNFTVAGGQSANALAKLRTDGSLDPTFTAPFSPGDSVPALVRQPKDGNIVASRVLAATSSSGNLAPQASLRPRTQSIIKNPIVRCVGDDGSLDPAFYTGAGTDGTAYALGIQSDAANAGRIVVAGNFSQLNATSGHANLGRLNTDGTLDTGFAATANATVQTVLIQADGQLVVGGIFTQVDGMPHARLARLNAADGTLDASFSTSAGTDGPVAGLMQQSDGRLVVAGTFATVNGTARSCLARLNPNGTLDTTFNAGAISLSGGTALVSSIDQQTDGKLVIGGLFDHINGTARPNVARLNTDGSVDTTFDPGSGTDAIVRVVTLQPDGKTLLGGDFSTVDGLERDAAARLLGDYDLDAYPALGQWRIINFGQPASTGNAADTAAPYGDGVPNLVKYALNLDPQGADATPMTATGTKGLPLVGKDATGKYLTLTFVRRQAATAPGVSYLVEFANALNSPTGFATNPAATSAVTTLDATWEARDRDRLCTRVQPGAQPLCAPAHHRSLSAGLALPHGGRTSVTLALAAVVSRT